MLEGEREREKRTKKRERERFLFPLFFAVESKIADDSSVERKLETHFKKKKELRTTLLRSVQK